MQLMDKKQWYCDNEGNPAFTLTQAKIGRPDFHVSLSVPEVVTFYTQEDVEFFINELEKAWSNSPC